MFPTINNSNTVCPWKKKNYLAKKIEKRSKKTAAKCNELLFNASEIMQTKESLTNGDPKFQNNQLSWENIHQSVSISGITTEYGRNLRNKLKHYLYIR